MECCSWQMGPFLKNYIEYLWIISKNVSTCASLLLPLEDDSTMRRPLDNVELCHKIDVFSGGNSQKCAINRGTASSLDSQALTADEDGHI
jgi:hypothetical protein